MNEAQKNAIREADNYLKAAGLVTYSELKQPAEQAGGEVVAVPIQHPRSVQWVLESIEAGGYGSYQEAWRDLLIAAGAEVPAAQAKAQEK